MAAKKKAKAKRAKKVKKEFITDTQVVLLGGKFNRADELAKLLNLGYQYQMEIASRAGVYVVLTAQLEVEAAN